MAFSSFVALYAHRANEKGPGRPYDLSGAFAHAESAALAFRRLAPARGLRLGANTGCGRPISHGGTPL